MSAEQVDCGCRLVYHFDNKVSVYPCSREHRDLALKIRHPNSRLIVKPYPTDTKERTEA